MKIYSNLNEVKIFCNPKKPGKGCWSRCFVYKRDNDNSPLKLDHIRGMKRTIRQCLNWAEDYLNNGVPIENIKLNGQPITDKFQKNESGKWERIGRQAGDTFKKQKSDIMSPQEMINYASKHPNSDMAYFMRLLLDNDKMNEITDSFLRSLGCK